jgi:hypothetical protein
MGRGFAAEGAKDAKGEVSGVVLPLVLASRFELCSARRGSHMGVPELLRFVMNSRSARRQMPRPHAFDWVQNSAYFDLVARARIVTKMPRAVPQGAQGPHVAQRAQMSALMETHQARSRSGDAERAPFARASCGSALLASYVAKDHMCTCVYYSRGGA